jgi:hypothetical protein
MKYSGSVGMTNCEYCGCDIDPDAPHKVVIECLKGSIFHSNGKTDISINNQTFCDTDCLQCAIDELQWISETDEKMDQDGRLVE